ncbi:MAG: hypothetical protein L3I99_07800 [Sulfurimonas sp.]|nr:hypothetical protein [Sulfurimonas sp.]
MMEEVDIQSQKYKFKAKKGIFLLLIMIFIAGNIGFYFQERAKWIYEGQPYPEAKEWLVPANMMLVYGTTLSRLPFIDERSLIMKPIIGLQDYFVSKWQEKLPDDDAEKYLGWYVFKYNGGIVHNSKSIIMYYENRYSYDETREALDNMWHTLEHIIKYQAKDKEFIKMRYGAFNNLSLAYLKNASIYWYYENKTTIDIYSMRPKQYSLDMEMMLNDIEKTDRYILLFESINKMNYFYKNNYTEFYNASRNEFSENSRMSDLIAKIIFVFYKTNTYQNINLFCDIEKNIYLKEHIKNRNTLIDFLKNSKDYSSIKKQYINTRLKRNADREFNKICKKLNLIQGIKYGNN